MKSPPKIPPLWVLGTCEGTVKAQTVTFTQVPDDNLGPGLDVLNPRASIAL